MHLTYSQGRLKAFARIEKVASSSEVAKDPKQLEGETFLYDCRNATGPPVTIYHPAFARLKEDIRCIDRLDLRTDLPSNWVARTSQLFLASRERYVKEEDCLEKIRPILSTLLDVQLALHVRMYDQDGGRCVAEFDAAASVPLRESKPYDRKAVYVCAEFKNELGTSGAGGVQIAATYAHAVAHGDAVSALSLRIEEHI